jgi:hypothetical protein
MKPKGRIEQGSRISRKTTRTRETRVKEAPEYNSQVGKQLSHCVVSQLKAWHFWVYWAICFCDTGNNMPTDSNAPERPRTGAHFSVNGVFKSVGAAVIACCSSLPVPFSLHAACHTTVFTRR